MVEPPCFTCYFYFIDMPGAWDGVKITRVNEVHRVGGCSLDNEAAQNEPKCEMYMYRSMYVYLMQTWPI